MEFKVLQRGRTVDRDLLNYSETINVRPSAVTKAVMALEGGITFSKDKLTLVLEVRTRRNEWLTGDDAVIVARVRWAPRCERAYSLRLVDAERVVPLTFWDKEGVKTALAEDQGVREAVLAFLARVRTVPAPTVLSR